MSTVEDIQAEDFLQQVKASDKPAVLLFWMRSCDGCRMFKPVYQQLPGVVPEARFFRMNMMKSIPNLRLSEELGVELTPTTVVFCNGGLAGSMVGHMPLDEAVEALQSILGSC